MSVIEREDFNDAPSAAGHYIAQSAVRALAALCDTDRFRRFLEEVNLPTELRPELLEGYKFAICTQIYWLRSEFVDNPALFGMEPDGGAFLVEHYGDDRFWVPRGQAQQHVAIRWLAERRKCVLSAADWAALHEETLKLGKLVDYLNEWLEPATLLPSDEKPEIAPLPESSIDFLWTHIHDGANLHWAYSNTYPSSARPAPSLDDVGPNRSRGPEAREFQLFSGFAPVVTYLWRAALTQEDWADARRAVVPIAAIRTWEALDDTFGTLRPVAEKHGAMKTLDLILRSVRPPPSVSKAPPWGEASVSAPRKRESWRDRFENRPVRTLVDGDAIRGHMAFLTIANGLRRLPTNGKTKLRLLWLRHPENPFGRVHSFAFFVPSGSAIGNSSEYWVLHGVAGGDGMAGGQLELLARKYIEKFRDEIDFVEYEVEDEGELESFLLPDREKSRRADEIEMRGMLAGLRGHLGEALASLILMSDGYTILGRRVKLQALRGQEADLVAFKAAPHPEIVLLESKGTLRFIPFDAGPDGIGCVPAKHVDKVTAFLRACSRVKSDPAPLVRELRLQLTASSVAIRPIVTTLAELDNDSRNVIAPMGEAWSPREFARRLKAIGYTSTMLNELETMRKLDKASQWAFAETSERLDGDYAR